MESVMVKKQRNGKGVVRKSTKSVPRPHEQNPRDCNLANNSILQYNTVQNITELGISLEELAYCLTASEEMRLRQLATNSFYEFVKQAWQHIEGDNEFVDNWHIKAICLHLEACFKRQIHNLMIHIPPRCMKSTLISVMFPCWVWIHDSSERFLYASYAASLSVRDSLKCRRLISSPWYQARWGHLFQLMPDNNLKSRFENNKGGYRISGSVGSSITGEGGSIIICDDPNNAKDGESEVMRQSTNDWYSQVWSTRLNNQKTGVKIIVQQRLHEMDLSGYILSNDEDKRWVKMILPMEFEESRKCKTVPFRNEETAWQDPRTKEGELLWPIRIGEKELKQLKNDLGSAYNISGQLQQSPSPSGGGIFKRDEFKIWKRNHYPKIEFIIASWDTALSDSDFNTAYSACTVWGYFKDENNMWGIILLNMFKAKIPFTDLRKIAKSISIDYRDDGRVEIRPENRNACDIVLVEAKANGLSLIHELRAIGINAVRFDPVGDKTQRAQLISAYVQCGMVYVPAMAPSFNRLKPFADEFVDLCAKFPMDDASKDVVDSFSQVVTYLKSSGYLRYKEQEQITQDRVQHDFYGVDRG
jgi:predicted phage terminase large subunit-like protein